MKINVLPLIKQTADGLQIKLEISPQSLQLSAHITGSLENIFFTGNLTLAQKDIFHLAGELKVKRKGSCDRCLAAAEQTYFAQLAEKIYKTKTIRKTIEQAEHKLAIDDEEEFYSFKGHIIDLTKIIRDAVLLNMPGQLLCQADCTGFCPTCGKNLNDEICKCQLEPTSNSPFAKLGQLLSED